MPAFVVLAVVLWISQGCLATSALKMSSWRPKFGQRFQKVISSQATIKCRSSLECVLRCMGYTHCDRVAFRQSTSSCYLLPITESGAAEDDVRMFENEDPICPVKDVSIANAEVLWHHTLTSVEGDVNCHSHYTGNISDVTVKCSANNTWTTEGRCVIKYWLNPLVAIAGAYHIPRAPSVGWKMCVTGTPFADASLIVLEMYDGKVNRPLKLVFRFTINETMFLSYINGSFTPEHQKVTSPAFPLSESTPFLLELVASSDFILDVYVNGTFYHSSHTLPVSVTTLIAVKFSYDLNMHELDLWCQ